jgi:hypothetical protein
MLLADESILARQPHPKGGTFGKPASVPLARPRNLRKFQEDSHAATISNRTTSLRNNTPRLSLKFSQPYLKPKTIPP